MGLATPWSCAPTTRRLDGDHVTDPVDPGFSIFTADSKDHPDLTFGDPRGALRMPPNMPPLDAGQLSQGGATIQAEPADAPVVPTFTPVEVPEEHLLDPIHVEPTVTPDA
jgi:hypothetical protein